MLRSRKTYLILIITAVFVLSSIIYVTVQDNYLKNKRIVENDTKQVDEIGLSKVATADQTLAKNDENKPMALENAEEKNLNFGRKPDFKDIKVKALYISGPSAGRKDRMEHIIDLINKTELNAVVIDIKEGGSVNYNSNVSEVKDNKLSVNYYDPKKLITQLHNNNIFVIGRIVCFRDPGLSSKRPDLAIKKKDGSIWKEDGVSWTNPYIEEVRNYNLDIAKEAVELGFDEIQFDYVRFPSDAKKDAYYGENVAAKADLIYSFLKTAGKEISDGMSVPVSADTFGIICESKVDGERIGQVLERIGLNIDYICPMVYPSHFANASNGIMGNGAGQFINGVKFVAPDLEPYSVVYNALIKTKERISQVSGYRAKIRPYLQDFTASYIDDEYYQVYGPKQVREQMEAVYDSGCEEWILWSGTNVYSEDALKLE